MDSPGFEVSFSNLHLLLFYSVLKLYLNLLTVNYKINKFTFLQKQFDFGPSLLDEMDAAFRNYSSPPPPPPPPSSSSTCHSMVNEIVGNGSGTQHSNQHEQQNKRNESLSATSKKLATVSVLIFKQKNDSIFIILDLF